MNCNESHKSLMGMRILQYIATSTQLLSFQVSQSVSQTRKKCVILLLIMFISLLRKISREGGDMMGSLSSGWRLHHNLLTYLRWAAETENWKGSPGKM